MKKGIKKLTAIVFALLLTLSTLVVAFADDGTEAKNNAFSEDAYATVITASDFQRYTNEAYDRFDTILNLAVKEGLPQPDSLLIGGDYTMVLNDDARPGIGRIRHTYLSAFPGADANSVVFLQGNHDNPRSEFVKTGFYDMGAFCLYAINEDDFPWKQSENPADGVIALSKDIDSKLTAMTQNGDTRPVIVITHVPLHHTNRNGYGDNMYSSYIFNVLNKNGEKLDIIYLFGHNHSGEYDNYIGGAVNYMAPGETIRIPFADKAGESCYTEEKLNFTYTNCGYMGSSKNSNSDGSTSTLTMGVIQITPDKLRFIRYSEKGLYSVNEVTRVNPGADVKAPLYPETVDSCICHSDNFVFRCVWTVRKLICRILRINPYCVCGENHY